MSSLFLPHVTPHPTPITISGFCGLTSLQEMHSFSSPGFFLSSADEPFIPSRGDSAQSTGCDRYMAVHSRLDIIEETVEKTVEHLEAEVKGLLGQLEELAWNLPPAPFSPIPDLLGDGDDRF
ncbi:hypothetical protein FD755_006311 [Muntiacus reevesi]|uniref:Placenta-specific protein 9 n=1 Tax=Muntiacus reevesi TaxID=9886 RepID=A0A5J5MVU2_MUNRE|nr:hypothetical protein FD755_006311 [Muntiacus reevesi]